MTTAPKFATAALGLLTLAVPARALTFNLTYDTSVSSRSDFSQIQAADNYVASEYSSLFNNPITVNILVKESNSVSGGESSTPLISTDYTTLRNAYFANASSPDQITAKGNFPAADPTGGLTPFTTTAEAKALGLFAANNPASDGTFTFGPGPYTYDQNNRAVPGKDDFIGTAEHEFSEIMGRNTSIDQPGNYQPYDLFRYTAAGVRSLSGTATTAYFSLDQGNTNLKQFNPAGNGGDIQDWATSTPPDSYDASGTSNEKAPITAVDVRAMNILGYNLAAVPEPSTIFAGFSVLGLVALRRRSRR